MAAQVIAIAEHIGLRFLLRGQLAFLTGIVLLSATLAASFAVEIIAHRGASFDAPENTLAAVQLGWRQNADAVEIDIHLSSDGKVIVSHDGTTKRTTGVDLEIARTSSTDLRKLDAGSWKGPAWTGEKLPLLEEILPTIPKSKRLFIEIKSGPETLPELEHVLTKSGTPPAQLVIIGFSLETMQKAKERFPNLKVFWLSSFKQDKETGVWAPSADDLIRQAIAARVDGLNLSAKMEVLDEVFVRKIRSAGLQFYTWTVDDVAVAKRMRELGVDGITTNRPEWLREQLR